MYWHTRRKQIWSSSETNEPIYVVGSNTGWTVIRVKHEDYQQHKWARSFRWKTKSAFFACAITFRFYSTQDRGFKPGRNRRIYSGKKILSTPSFGMEVKPCAPCRRF